jgi:tRNA-dependent cyclodipeptide synthase
VDTTPAHLKGWELVKQRGLMTVGISLGNGYFSRRRLEVLLTGMASYFSELVVIVPDLPTLHSYRALGYDEQAAMQKVESHSHLIINRCKTIFNEIAEAKLKVITKIVTWQDSFAQEDYYREIYSYIINIYQNKPEFRQEVQKNTEYYILARLEDKDLHSLGGMKVVVEKAAYYLLEEIAFHIVSHLVLGKEPILSYYKSLELITNCINGKYCNPQNIHAGILVYSISDS